MTTPTTSEARKQLIEDALAAAPDSGPRIPIKWREGELVLPVVQVDVDVVLLNPNSHRIRSLLESRPDRGKAITENPFSEASQTEIADLLRSTEGFTNIKNALARDRQQEPGVLTRAGVLVNANTRAVALRDLKQHYVKAVVLPPDATEKEITLLELELQMERDVKQEYSFTARLLFIEELMSKLKMTSLEVGQRLRPDLTNSKSDQRKAKDEVEQELRLLSVIRRVIDNSAGALTLADFDGWRQGLIEIDDDYQRLSTTNAPMASRIRDAQLAGLIAGVDYRRLRQVDENLLDRYVLPAMREQASLADIADRLVGPGSRRGGTSESPSGLDVLGESGPEPEGDGADLGQVYDLLARSSAESDIDIPGADGAAPTAVSRRSLAAGLKSSLETAILTRTRDERKLDALTAPAQYLKEAAKSLDDARTAWLEVRNRDGFDPEAFRASLEEAKRAHDDLDQTIDGDG